MKIMQKLKLLNSYITIGSFKQIVDYIFFIADQYSSSYVCVCNVHMIIEAKIKPDFNNVLNNADIVTADGMPVAKVLSYQYNINQPRIAGMDLLPELVFQCAKRDKSIFFYGSSKDILAKIRLKIEKKYSDLRVDFYSPPFRLLNIDEQKKVVNDINKFKPDFVFVCLGCPKQENWMYKHKNLINSCMIGFGGAFNVYSGLQKRAPNWMIKNSLEWLFRLYLEPLRLFRRYFVTNILFIFYLCIELISNKKK